MTNESVSAEMGQSTQSGGEQIAADSSPSSIRPTGAVSTFNVSDPDPNNINSDSGKEWFLAEGVPGVGEKPEWYAESKYKTVAEQAAAQPELRKALGGREKSPEEYTVNLAEEVKDVAIDVNSDLFKNFSKYAHEKKLSQEDFDKAINMYSAAHKNSNTEFMKAIENDIGDEYKNLGLDYQKSKEELTNWLFNNAGENNKEFIEKALLDPYLAKVVQLIKDKRNVGMSAPANEVVKKDMQYFTDKMKDPRYGGNIQYSQAVDAEMTDAVKRGMMSN